jgi:seryl-tRNA(Sec) selenium transferase
MEGDAPSPFKSLGVEPFINCGGVRSTFGGSRILPEAMDSMNKAAAEFVDLDELAIGAGRELAAITGAQWGIVTSCTTAAMALATAACMAGHNPERMLRLPDATAMPNKVVIPRAHRFAYDFVFKTVGAVLVEFASVEELLRVLDGSVAMVCLLGRANTGEDFSNADIIRIAKSKRVPVLVDAAAQTPTYPDRWLEAGADLVVYAGGKFLRGPQSTGFLLGAENLCKMAWLNGPPHQAFGRAMKVGKEEIIGAVRALRHFLHERDANAEALEMERRLEAIDGHLGLAAVTTQIVPASATWHSPRIRVSWDRDAVDLTGEEVRVEMDRSRPRIHIHDFWSSENSIVVDPFNFHDGDAEIVGSALARLFRAHLRKATREPQPRIIDVGGQWEVEIDYLHGRVVHTFRLETVANGISGSHRSLDSDGEISGTVAGKTFRLTARHAGHPTSVYYSFSGEVDGETMSGEVALGAAADEHFGPVFRRQFGTVRWSARRKASALPEQTSSTEDHVR